MIGDHHSRTAGETTLLVRAVDEVFGTHTMGQPVMRVVMAVYRQGDTAVRARCLDVIDRLSERDAHGWRDLIEDER
jgi:hypothetical protein